MKKFVHPFTQLLGKSPIKPIQEHMHTVTNAAYKVPLLFEALQTQNAEILKTTQDEIYAFEQAADEQKKKIRMHLPGARSLWMPVNRGDLLQLIHLQEGIASASKDIAKFLSMKNLHFTQSLQDSTLAYAACCAKACKQAKLIVFNMSELITVGFNPGPERSNTLEMIESLNQIESQSDVMGMQLMRELLSNETHFASLTHFEQSTNIFLWHKIFERLGDMADMAEKVGKAIWPLMAD